MEHRRGLRWAVMPGILAGTWISPLRVDGLIGSACLLKMGLISDARFEAQLKRYFGSCLPDVWTELALAKHSRVLSAQAAPYKTPLVDVGTSAVHSTHPGLWRRRLGILRGLGIRLDLMTLTSAARIKPHGHSKVVSGFLVLEGGVSGQSYDRLAVRPGAWLLRRTFDSPMGPGAFLTNSEWSNNIHALQGRARRSLLLRVTVSGFSGQRFDKSIRTERTYVDLSDAPTGCEPFWASLSDGSPRRQRIAA
jgi:hypothetical protein